MEQMQLEKQEERAPCAPVLSLGISGLALILGRSVQTVKNQMYREPNKIPPWVANALPRIWHIGTVNDWLAERSKLNGSTLTPRSSLDRPQLEEVRVKRGRGRPRKLAGVKNEQ